MMGPPALASRALRQGLPAMLALTALLLSACTDGPAKVTSGQTEATPDATTASRPFAEQRGSDLIAGPDAPFQVIFKWRNPARGEQGLLIWTQIDGRRRWDLVAIDDGKALGGSVSLETHFSPGAIRGSPSLGCIWMTGDFPPDHVFVSCGSGGQLIFNPIVDALFSVVDRRLDDRTIAGRSAACYSFADRNYSLAAFCVDATDGTPLLLTTDSRADSLFSQSMEAVSVSTAEPDLAVPFGLQADPAKGFPDYEGVVPLSDLGLPDLSDLEP